MKHEADFNRFPHLHLTLLSHNRGKIISTRTQWLTKVGYILILIRSEPPNLTISANADIRPERIFAGYLDKCVKMICVKYPLYPQFELIQVVTWFSLYFTLFIWSVMHGAAGVLFCCDLYKIKFCYSYKAWCIFFLFCWPLPLLHQFWMFSVVCHLVLDYFIALIWIYINDLLLTSLLLTTPQESYFLYRMKWRFRLWLNLFLVSPIIISSSKNDSNSCSVKNLSHSLCLTQCINDSSSRKPKLGEPL